VIGVCLVYSIVAVEHYIRGGFLLKYMVLKEKFLHYLFPFMLFRWVINERTGAHIIFIQIPHATSPKISVSKTRFVSYNEKDFILYYIILYYIIK